MLATQVKQSILRLGMNHGGQQRIGRSGRGISVHSTIIAWAAWVKGERTLSPSHRLNVWAGLRRML